jgi:hypothetical protein
MGLLTNSMRRDPKPMIEKLLKRQMDMNSAAAREIIQEVAERVLRDLSPENQRELLLPLKKASAA